MRSKIKKIIITTFIFIVAYLFVVSFFALIVKKNFYVFGHIPCDSEYYNCFVDLNSKSETYLKLYKKAYLFKECNDSESECNKGCDEINDDCKIISCTDENLSENEECVFISDN